MSAAAGPGWPLALRIARRELRGGVRGFRVFLACLALGVGAIAAIGSLGASVNQGIRRDARVLLGGDVVARLAYRAASPQEHEFLAGSGELSEVAVLRAMARSPAGDRRSLIELKAVDAAYPLYGGVELNPTQTLGEALARRDGVFGAAVDPVLADRLGVKIGDRLKIGDGSFELRALIAREPDVGFSAIAFGPRVLLGKAALADTGLIRPGALVNYEYRLRLRSSEDPARWAETARAAFPDAGWQIRTPANAAPSLERLIGRIGFFLDLVGVTALLVGGIGIGNAVAGYVASKTETIATLKCLGAPARLVFTAYLLQTTALALAGIGVGLALGALAPLACAPFLSGLLPGSLRLGIHPAPLAVAGLCGVLTTAAFALWPLAAVGRVPPAALFRDRVAPARRFVPWSAAIATGLAALGLAALIVATAADRVVAVWYVAGVIAGFALFRGAGALIVATARRLGRAGLVRGRPLWRLGVANLHRPDAPTARIVLSLGIGLSVLVAIGLVEGNLAQGIEMRLAERAPGYFFIDIQPDQLAGFTALVHATPGAAFDEMPMLRGRITRLNGVPVEQVVVAPEAQWALRNDRGLTYATAPPPGSQIVAGEWWPEDYHGPPLISFDAALAQGMGLKPGDSLSVNLLGREIEARIANLRQIDWARLGINFAVVFAPGTLEAAPQTHLAAVYLPQAQEEQLVRAVTDRYPNISAIPVREALASVARIVATIGTALRLVALVALAAGMLVLGGAIAAGYRRRVYDAVVLKVLGASRRAIAAAFLAEYGLLGAATAIVAAGFGTAAAYALVTRAMHMEWVFLPLPLLGIVLLAVGLTLGLGFAGTWRALGAKPAPLLRNE